MNISDDVRSQLSTTLDLSDDDIFEMLGEDLLGSGPGAAPMDPDRSRRFGKQWFEHNLAELRRIVCSNPLVLACIEDPRSDRAAQAAVLWELLSSTEPFQMHAVLVSVLATKFGLAELCRNYSANS